MKILVVDDDQSSRYYLRTLLEAHQAEVVEAENGLRACRLIHKERFDLIVSDLMMPVMDGFTLLSEVRDHDEIHTTPFVIYTGTYVEDEDKELALHLGADLFLTKPTPPEPLWESLQSLLSAGPESQARLSTEEKLLYARKHSESLVRKLTQRNRQLEKSRQELLQESREKKAILDALQAPAAILDTDGSILTTNRAWSESLPASKGHAQQFQEVALCEGIEFDEGEFGELLAGRRGSLFLNLPEPEVPAQSHYRCLITALEGEGLGALVLYLDVTEQKRLEAQLLRSQRLESIGTMASEIAHDLNNGLLPIFVAVDLLKEQVEFQDRDRELLTTIEDSALRGRDLVRQLLMFARGTAGGRRPLDVTKILEEVYSIVRETFPGHISVTMEKVEEPLWIQGDPTQVHQVLLNLCLNSRDALNQDGEIIIRARPANPAELQGRDFSGEQAQLPVVCIEVEDSGPGIPEDIRSKIFEPFFTTKSLESGTGLGLSSSKMIVENHDGVLELVDRTGTGALFRILIPRVSDKSVEVEPPKPSATEETTGGTILVVDDEGTTREMFKELLLLRGHAVVKAKGALEALALLRQDSHRFSGLVMDLPLRDVEASTLASEIRRASSRMPVILCSAEDKEALQMMEDFGEPVTRLGKPFDKLELYHALDKLRLGSV